MAGRSNFDGLDAATDGELSRDLRAWREQDPPVSYDEIVARLRERGIVTTSETVRRWWTRLADAA